MGEPSQQGVKFHFIEAWSYSFVVRIYRERGGSLCRDIEPFLTLSRSELAGVGGGSGLGLAIARQAVLANGGRISAQRSAEGGLLVEIELPAEP